MARHGSPTASMRAVCLSKVPVIVIVDDDEAMRDALSELVQVIGFSSKSFGRAAAFLANYTPGRFACLITDVRMPGMDGIDLQRRLRALGSTIPVVFLTSVRDPATQARALEGGACAYLAKPVDHITLLDHLRSALGSDDAPGEQVSGEKTAEG